MDKGREIPELGEHTTSPSVPHDVAGTTELSPAAAPDFLLPAQLSDLPMRADLDSVKALNPDERSPKQSIGRLLLEFAILIIIAFGATWVIRTFVVQTYEVPSASMQPTIMIGDKFAADMLFYKVGGVKKDDVVCFNDKTQLGRILVKRVIAVGGQTVNINNGNVEVDGVILFEPYTHGSLTKPIEEHFQNLDISYPYVVPEGHIWVMGDNRGQSADSRFFGVINEEEILGRALFVFWPFDNIKML